MGCRVQRFRGLGFRVLKKVGSLLTALKPFRPVLGFRVGLSIHARCW